MIRPVLVTGHGRSGSHWLAHVLGRFVDASHEPGTLSGDVVVDCHLRARIPELRDKHPMLHLVRDGRDVVRSVHRYYAGRFDVLDIARGWADAVDECQGLEAVRLEDLLAPQDPSDGYLLSHWREWPSALTRDFWSICGEQMRRHGYTEGEP